MDTMLEKIAFVVASGGFAVSAVVHATTLLTTQTPPPAVPYALFAGAAVSGLLASMVAPRPATSPWTLAQLRSAVLDAVPFWMRAAFYALLAYAVLQFGMLVVGLPPQTSAFSSPLGARLFSSYGLLLYFSVITVCTAAKRRHRTVGSR